MSAPVFSDPADAGRFALYRAAQVEEYGEYEAVGEIRVGGALAFTAGHPVPKSTVEANGWDVDGLVRRVERPAAGEDRAALLRARRERLALEAAAVDAELAEAEAADDEADEDEAEDADEADDSDDEQTRE